MGHDLAQSAETRRTRWFFVGASIIVCGAGGFEFLRFLLKYVHCFKAGIFGDLAYYFGMGRGLLNGFHLYTDLFESKPPVIFWLSALSLLITKDDTFYRLLLAIMLAAIPMALSLFTFQLNRRHGRQICLLFVGVAFLFGSAIASFAIDRSQAYQTEGYGVVFAIFSLLFFACRSTGEARKNSWWIGASASCFAIAALTKEPFTIAVLGGLVLLVSAKQDLKDAAKVITLGGLIAIGLLIASGTAHGYFSVYLPEIFSGRIPQNVMYHDYRDDTFLVVPASLWVRGLEVTKQFHDMWSPAQGFIAGWFPFLALAIAVLILTHQASGAPEDRRWGWFIIGTITIVCFLLFLDLARLLEQVLAFLQFKVPWEDSFFRGRLLLLLVYGLAWLGPFFVLMRQAPGTAKRVAATIVAVYLGSVAIATGGEFRLHYFVFAVPVYFSFFVSLVRNVAAPAPRPLTTATLGVVACLLVLNAVTIPRFPYAELDRMKPQVPSTMVSQVQQFDALLDSCDYTRYLHLFLSDVKGRENSVLRLAVQGLTIHSPYQLDYGLLRAFPRDQEDRNRFRFDAPRPNAFLHAKFLKDFAETPIVVYARETVPVFADAEMQQAFQQQFSGEAPRCAQPFLPIQGLSLYFRHSPGSGTAPRG